MPDEKARQLVALEPTLTLEDLNIRIKKLQEGEGISYDLGPDIVENRFPRLRLLAQNPEGVRVQHLGFKLHTWYDLITFKKLEQFNKWMRKFDKLRMQTAQGERERTEQAKVQLKRQWRRFLGVDKHGN